MAQAARQVTGDASAAPRSQRRHPAGALRLLPPTRVPMTPEQEERAVEALAGLLAEAEQRRAGEGGSARPAP